MIKLYNADVLEGLARIPDQFIDCVVTSPPYWALRDYEVPGQIGLEAFPELYIERMVNVFNEVRRVLKKAGTLWLNMGDTYISARGRHSNKNRTNKNKSYNLPIENRIDLKDHDVLKDKDLAGIPWRLAFALQEAGWWLRSAIIWYKPNPVPECVQDRPVKSYENIFLMSRSSNYYYDADAIREPHKEPGRGHGTPEKNNWSMDGKRGSKDTVRKYNPLGKHSHDVWIIQTKASPEAHFATFPPEVPERCIKAGSKENGFVLDPFAGIGTTGEVAVQLGRHFIGIEISERYFSTAYQRIHAADKGITAKELRAGQRTLFT